MAPLQPVRGTRDLIGEDARRHFHVIDTAKRIATLHGFEEWATPVFEDTRVFSRTLGETSDVVTKEMYSFEDRGGDSITLRPEGTAGICRALVTNGLTQTLPQKVFYAGPMFRYERPQKGRYRQFHQIGVELLGPRSPLADAEIIACGWQVLKALGLEQHVTLEINTLGDRDSRKAYRDALHSYILDYKADLSPESLVRLEKNPLRILDTKDAKEREILQAAPSIHDFLSADAASFFAGVRDHLEAFGIGHHVNPAIVRGLDYYNDTTFEFITTSLGAQGTVLAGGRYDGLVAEMGGPSIPGVGWASGIDRLAMLLEAAPKGCASVAIVTESGALDAKAIMVARALRDAGVKAEIAFQTGLKGGLKWANRIGAETAVIVTTADSVQLKNLTDGSQVELAIGDLVAQVMK